MYPEIVTSGASEAVADLEGAQPAPPALWGRGTDGIYSTDK